MGLSGKVTRMFQAAPSVAVRAASSTGSPRDHLHHVPQDMAARVTGPMQLRLLLQPLMASFFAIRSGLADARAGKPPYFWALFSDPAHRADVLKDGWKSVGKVFVLAMMLDVVYQIVATRFVYPGEAIVTAILLAIAPYLILRALTTRLVRQK